MDVALIKLNLFYKNKLSLWDISKNTTKAIQEESSCLQNKRIGRNDSFNSTCQCY